VFGILEGKKGLLLRRRAGTRGCVKKVMERVRKWNDDSKQNAKKLVVKLGGIQADQVESTRYSMCE
jgi:hypothetical protein